MFYMVWWRTLLKIICSLLLITSLIFFIISLSFSQTLSYSNLKPVLTKTFKEQMGQIDQTELAHFHSELIQNCTASGAETIDVPLGKEPGSESIILKCADIKTTPPQGLVDLIAEGMFDKIYYREYECSFIECFDELDEDEKFFVFTSEFASRFFKTISNLFLIAIIIFIALIVLLCVPKYSALVSIGTNFTVIGLLLFVVKVAKAKIPMPEEVSLLFNPFFNYLSTYFSILLIAGLALLVVGIIVIFRQKKKQARRKT